MVSGGEPLAGSARAALAAEIALAYLSARAQLRRWPLERALANLRAGPPRAPSGPPVHQAARLGRAVARTLALLPGDTRCLTRALVLSRLLARRGIAARLVIGARAEPEFLAHAWVECGGVAVLDPGDGSFARLVEL
jgi:Transglutaminase-like superfamily